MPGDPNECRANAKECLREAASARTSTDKLTFQTLAQKWLRTRSGLRHSPTSNHGMGPTFPKASF